ncbi:MAG: hypothetical protein GY757_07215, partial [bacterium]|nr:hypothetical protein [bacterium]
GLLPTAVSLSQVDVNSDKGLNSKAEDDDSPGLGKKDAQIYKAPNVPGAIIYPRHNITDSKAEMDILSKNISQRSGWFVTGEGMIAGNLYGHVLKAGKTVTIKGVNKTYSGEYYVSHVTHSFSSKGYFQAFKVKRDALMPTGMENFGVKKIW